MTFKQDYLQPVRGFGSVHGAPGLPAGFTKAFESYLVDTGALKLHGVIGGEGPPVLLLAGWPQSWYAWRFLMQPLAKRFTVIAVDPRGVGRSDKPEGGYDSQTLAADLLTFMTKLGYEQFAMVGHDIGMWTGYAMASDQPGRISRIALGEAIIPGVSPSPPLITDERAHSDFLWHFNFNRALQINEALVAGREEIFFGHQFQTKAGSPFGVSAEAQAFYIELLKQPAALRASFDYYRAIDQSIPQNRERAKTKLTIPVFSFAGQLAGGDFVEHENRTIATDVTAINIPGCGHYPPEEAPEALLKGLEAFLSPYAVQHR